MIHTNLPRNRVVFFLLCELTRSAIYVSKKFDSHKWTTVLVDEVKGKPCNCQGMFVWIIVFYFYNIFLPGCKSFSKTNSTDPRQRVPLSVSLSFTTRTNGKK